MKINSTIRWLSIVLLVVIASSLFPAQVVHADDWRVGTFFFGTIQTLPNTPGFIGDWKVNNTIVHVSSNTVVDQQKAAVALGAVVAVQGWPKSDGSVDGTLITVIAGVGDKVKFFGMVKALPNTSNLVGDWTVMVPIAKNTIVHVTNTTKIDQTKGQAVVGAIVKVEGVLKNDQSVDATSITVIFVPQGQGKTVVFLGKVESLPSGGMIGEWNVSGINVHVSASTEIDQTRAKVEVGAFVQVKGIAQADGSVKATEIEVRTKPAPPPVTKYLKFYGVVESLPAGGTVGTWIVSGMQVNVTNQTQIISGPAKVKSIVEVKGYLQTDGSINAVQVRVKGTVGNPNTLFGQSGAVGP